MHKCPLLHLLECDFDVSVKVRLASLLGNNYHSNEFSIAASTIFSGNSLSIVLDRLNYVSAIDYLHPGMTSLTYLDHPLRVASMSMVLPLTKSILFDSCVLALAHNVLETSSINTSELQKKLGNELTSAISMLTVDRSIQYESQYKDKYYEAISLSSEFIRVIKILDKLDNIYILGMNPSKSAKDYYIFEINNYVLPLCKGLPDILFDRLYGAIKKIQKNPSYLKEYPEYELLVSK